ncbi:MAG: 50S ribosomal protein L1, partial [Nanoarchaeota archaeon]|nr:50S ribosomal protein L1 [Nanoarchaeota archaeon]
MNKKAILDSIKKVREVSPKRKFPQTFDLIVNLQNIDVKNPEQKVDLFVQLHYPRGKKPRVCA